METITLLANRSRSHILSNSMAMKQPRDSVWGYRERKLHNDLLSFREMWAIGDDQSRGSN
jgi:hypothetical protein